MIKVITPPRCQVCDTLITTANWYVSDFRIGFCICKGCRREKRKRTPFIYNAF